MKNTYKSMNDELKKFPLYKIENRELVNITGEITNTSEYSHFEAEIHHFIKRQRYYRHPERYDDGEQEFSSPHDYKGNQKLIIMTKAMHEHLENPVYQLSSMDFYKKYRIWKSELLSND